MTLQKSNTNPGVVRRVTAGDWCVELLPRVPYEANYTSDTAFFGFAFDAQSGSHSFSSDVRRPFKTRANTLAFVPSGCDVYSYSGIGGEYLRVSNKFASSGVVQIMRFTDSVDKVAASAAHQLRRQLLMTEGRDTFFCEVLAGKIAGRAESLLVCSNDREVDPRWMTPFRLRRVEELIQGGLAEKITVADLARELGLSTGFFTRAFAAAVGRSPKDHIIDRRIGRARGLLRETDDPLSAIAYACGFASHSHMTTQFRKRLGVAPSQLRAKGVCEPRIR